MPDKLSIRHVDSCNHSLQHLKVCILASYTDHFLQIHPSKALSREQREQRGYRAKSARRCLFTNRNRGCRGSWCCVCEYERERIHEREERLQVEKRGGSLQGTKEWREGGNRKDVTKCPKNRFSPFLVSVETWTHTHTLLLLLLLWLCWKIWQTGSETRDGNHWTWRIEWEEGVRELRKDRCAWKNNNEEGNIFCQCLCSTFLPGIHKMTQIFQKFSW